MKTLQLAAAVLAVGALALPSGAETVTTNDWWDVDFTSPTPAVSVAGHDYGGTTLREGELGPLTNNASLPGFEPAVLGNQPWASGHWEMEEGDESYWTNDWYEVDVQGTPGFTFTNSYLKLDTQGNDLTWRPTNNNGVIKDVATLVDADLYLVGSDSPPDASDFDAKSDVQTAIYLKNELFGDDHPQAGETSNSVLCVFAWDPLANNNAGANYWQELKGVELEDNAWAHVQVVVDHSVSPAKISVYVNGTRMSARDGTAVDWPVANRGSLPEESSSRVRSVAFRGTGAVDNFVGKTMKTEYSSYNFTAQVYMDGSPVAAGPDENQTKVVNAEAGSGKFATFDGFNFHDLEVEWDENDDPIVSLTYTLNKIEIVDLSTGTTRVFNYTYDFVNYTIIPETVDDSVVHLTTGTGGVYSGPFTVRATTASATKDETLVRIYFESRSEPGQIKLSASQDVGTAPATQIFNNTDENLPESATFTFSQTLSAGGTDYVLSTIKPATAPAGIEVSYENPTVTVTVPLSASTPEGSYNVATAHYVEGTFAEGQRGKLVWNETDGLYDFVVSDPPVALRITVAEGTTTTNEYPSLRAAVTNAVAGDTIYLVADDRVSFTAEDTEIVINKALTIDGGSNTLYGVSGYAYDGVNDHDIFIGSAAGDVTFKNLKISEFSDTAPTVQYRTYPIWTSQAYAGTLTLDGVTVEKFARTAINLGNGNFVITNCAIKGYAGEASAPTRYFQNAITVKDAKGTVADTTATGIGSTAEPWGAGLVTFNSDGAGEIKFVSGSYTADYLIEVSSNATGKAVFEGGTFIATGEEASAFQLDEGEDATFYVNVTGGWFDRKPEAAVTVVRNPYAAVQDAANAPDPAATWTVAKPCTITFFEENGVTKFFETNVLTGTTGYGPTNEPPKDADAQYVYVFTGWTNAVAGGETVSTANLPAATGDAEWTATYSVILRSYTVKWVVTEAITNVDENVTYGTQVSAAADPAAGTYPNHTFKFWSADGTTEAAFPATVEGDLIFFAVWEESAGKPAVNPGDGLKDYVPGEGETVPAPIEFTDDAAPKCEISFVAPEAGWYVLYSSTTVNGEYTEDTASGKTVAKGELTTLVETTPGTTKFFKIYWSSSAPAGD